VGAGAAGAGEEAVSRLEGPRAGVAEIEFGVL